MKVLVLGATGGTGRLIVHDALEKGPSVVALVRSKARAPNFRGADIGVSTSLIHFTNARTRRDRLLRYLLVAGKTTC
jgi:putative NADH-flavin reductase